MTECIELRECRFFNVTMKQMPAVGKMMKSRYCLGDFTACARFRLAQEGVGIAVPVDLAPNDHKRAERLIAESSK